MLDRTKVRELFSEAMELPERDRSPFLDRACAGDAPLRAEIESLLAAAAKQPQFLAAPTTSVAPPGGEALGTRIGPYKLLQEIGQGGFGSVYLAEQETPVRRRVALKIIKLGMDTRAVIARFEGERQALAMMDHPHIAKVFDAGATDSGRPYFVMELVPGDPITVYADRANLTVPERLELFVQVCHAVQHAHSKGVIHRDIKPGNILVTTEDGRPHAKVIDFGIAKATEHRLTERTQFTEFRQLVGTPEYMSPEQAGGAPDVDARSDVYSLGVLLYELLTGVTPFDATTLRSAAYAEIQRIIREVDPPKPSTRLAQSGTLADVASHRRTAPKHLNAIISGDLDWIVMKALEKDRTRRYDTASGLAAEIQRHLVGAPVEAAPPNAAYRLRKFVRRNRAAVLAVSAVAMTLLAGAAVSIAFGVGEARQRAIAEASQQEARRHLQDLEQVARFQERQLAHIDAPTMGVRLRADLLDKARAAAGRVGATPEQRGAEIAQLERLIAGIDFTGMALKALDDNVFKPALEAIGDSDATDPLVKSRLLQALATTLAEVGLADAGAAPQAEALAIRRTALGEDHVDTLASMHQTGVLRQAQGRLPEAEDTLRDALDRRRRVLGGEHPDTLDSLNSLARVLWLRGKLDEAESCYREALAGRRSVLGNEHRDTIVTVEKTGGLLRARGKLGEAEPLCREALDSSRRVLGEDHRDTLTAMGAMAALLKAQGRLDEAGLLYRHVLEKSRRVRGDEHPDTVTLLGNLGGVSLAMGRPAEAESLLGEALAMRRRLLGDEHQDTLNSIINMGAVLFTQNKVSEAEPYMLEALRTSRRVLGDEHPDTLTALNNVGVAMREQHKLPEAEAYFRESFEKSRKRLGAEHPDTLISMFNLGGVLVEGHAIEAVQLLAPAEDAARKVFVKGHAVRLGQFLSVLGGARAANGEYDAAEANLTEAYDILRTAKGGNPAKAAKYLVDLFEARHRAAPDQGFDRKAGQWREKLESMQPPIKPPAP